MHDWHPTLQLRHWPLFKYCPLLQEVQTCGADELQLKQEVAQATHD